MMRVGVRLRMAEGVWEEGLTPVTREAVPRRGDSQSSSSRRMKLQGGARTGATSFDTRSTRLSQVFSVVRFLDEFLEIVTAQSLCTATSSPPLASPAPLLAMMMITRQMYTSACSVGVPGVSDSASAVAVLVDQAEEVADRRGRKRTIKAA